jgi:hypothetical protein
MTRLGRIDLSAVNLHRRLVALFVVLALAGCTQPAAGPDQRPLDPSSPHNIENVHDRGLGGGGI